jgi:hypothetical protein
MTELEIHTMDQVIEIGYNLDESEIPNAISELTPEARELLAEMATEAIARQRFIMGLLKALKVNPPKA